MSRFKTVFKRRFNNVFPEHEKALLFKLFEKRKTSFKDTYIILGQLDSIANESIDSIALFKWLVAHRVPAKYVLWEQNPQAKKLINEGYGNAVITLRGNGVSDFEFLEACFDTLVRTKVIAVENAAFNQLLKRLFFESDLIDFAFLQHGPTCLKNAFPQFVRFDFVNSTCEIEKKLLEENLANYPREKPYKQRYFLAGLPRWDLLKDESASVPANEKVVFVMPTFRHEFENQSPEIFEKSVYYQQLKKLFSPENLERFKAAGTRIVFAPHHYLLQLVKGIHYDFPVEIAGTHEISYWIRHASLCITDFSSVSFDFHFLEKPVIYWLFDADVDYHPMTKTQIEFAKKALKENNFVTADSIENLLELVENYTKNDFKLAPEQQENLKKYFAYKTGICEKIYQGIESAIVQKRRERWQVGVKLLFRFLGRTVNQLFPASRAKVEHSERHILEAINKQNSQLKSEVKKMRDELEKFLQK